MLPGQEYDGRYVQRCGRAQLHPTLQSLSSLEACPSRIHLRMFLRETLVEGVVGLPQVGLMPDGDS